MVENKMIAISISDAYSGSFVAGSVGGSLSASLSTAISSENHKRKRFRSHTYEMFKIKCSIPDFLGVSWFCTSIGEYSVNLFCTMGSEKRNSLIYNQKNV